MSQHNHLYVVLVGAPEHRACTNSCKRPLTWSVIDDQEDGCAAYHAACQRYPGSTVALYVVCFTDAVARVLHARGVEGWTVEDSLEDRGPFGAWIDFACREAYEVAPIDWCAHANRISTEHSPFKVRKQRRG